ncbi:MAG: dynamin family protein [Desulfobacterales bacterium]|nr:dynamin family protein [Desulfobacterales bacterium]
MTTMDGYGFRKAAFCEINQDVQRALPDRPIDSRAGGRQLRRLGEDLRRAARRSWPSDTIRVAVVGAIKSGKSTFLNALLKGDFLKRGAGVVTSIVTRVRAGRAAEGDAVLQVLGGGERGHGAGPGPVSLASAGVRREERFDIRREQRAHGAAAGPERPQRRPAHFR